MVEGYPVKKMVENVIISEILNSHHLFLLDHTITGEHITYLRHTPEHTGSVYAEALHAAVPDQVLGEVSFLSKCHFICWLNLIL